jgi:hypothetical protein
MNVFLGIKLVLIILKKIQITIVSSFILYIEDIGIP